jgi:hypothetical protein
MAGGLKRQTGSCMLIMKDLMTSKVTHHSWSKQHLPPTNPNNSILFYDICTQLLDIETIIHGQDYTGASTNMEYTAAFEMGHRLAVNGWSVTSIITNHDGKIHHAFQSAGTTSHTRSQLGKANLLDNMLYSRPPPQICCTLPH